MEILDLISVILIYLFYYCIQNKKQPTSKLEKENKVSVGVESQQDTVKVSSRKTQNFPTMISVDIAPLINNQNKNQRTPIDIICVIDTSTSMSGQKIEYVREALNILITLLNEDDRIMLVQFSDSANELLPLKFISKNNIPIITSAIQQLQSSGGTSIFSGIQAAVQGLQDRSFNNPITSVFLLSDGQDNYSSIDYLKQNGNLKDSPYTIHTFGFGQDHDSVLLNEICKVMDGNFYYVEQIDTVKQQFLDALGGLFSVVAQEMEVTVRLKNHSNKELNKISVAKTYGDMWVHNPKKNEYTILIKQFMRDVSKEFFLELQIPPIQHGLKQNERQIEVLEVETILYDNIDNKKLNPVKKVNQLTLTLYNENEKVPITKQGGSEKFELNYFRVRGADAIGQTINENRNGDFKKGQQILTDFQHEIEQSRKEEKLYQLYEDIIECLSFCDPKSFQMGLGKMISIQKSHMEKKTRFRDQKEKCCEKQEYDPFDYSTKTQQDMINQLYDCRK